MKRILVTLCAVALVFNADAQTGCLNSQDANQDGLIGVEDLMDLLSHWGDTDLDFDGVYDSVDLCTDEEACNYVLKPTEPCEYLDAVGVCGGDCAEDSDDDGVCDVFLGPCQGLEFVSFDGYDYDLVVIGDQCWFAENLRTEHYSNGDEILGELDAGGWANAGVMGIGAQAVWQNDSLNISHAGRLYNWYAIDDGRGLCPAGWHIPEDDEFMMLEVELGMSEVEASLTGERGADEGWQLKSSPEDSPPWNGGNTRGFSALNGGTRNSSGAWDHWWESFLWSASASGENSWLRDLDDSPTIERYVWNQSAGFSVRCLKDSNP